MQINNLSNLKSTTTSVDLTDINPSTIARDVLLLPGLRYSSSMDKPLPLGG
jgi:hypothetical protein